MNFNCLGIGSYRWFLRYATYVLVCISCRKCIISTHLATLENSAEERLLFPRECNYREKGNDTSLLVEYIALLT